MRVLRLLLKALCVPMIPDDPFGLTSIELGTVLSWIVGLIGFLLLATLVIGLFYMGSGYLFTIFSTRFISESTLTTNVLVFGGFSLTTMTYRKIYRYDSFEGSAEYAPPPSALTFIWCELCFYGFFIWQACLALTAEVFPSAAICAIGAIATLIGIAKDARVVRRIEIEGGIGELAFSFLVSIFQLLGTIFVAIWLLFGITGLLGALAKAIDT